MSSYDRITPFNLKMKPIFIQPIYIYIYIYIWTSLTGTRQHLLTNQPPGSTSIGNWQSFTFQLWLMLNVYFGFSNNYRTKMPI